MMWVDGLNPRRKPMLDAGGDPVERDAEREVLRPIYHHPQPPRPASRPVSVWVISLIIVTLGLLGAYVGYLGLKDALDHGEKERVVAAYGLGTAMSVAQLA